MKKDVSRILKSRQRTIHLPLMEQRRVVRYENNKLSLIEDLVTTEYALTIHVNNREMVTIVCLPEYLEELIIGFLAAEGVIRDVSQIAEMQISRFRGVARIRTHHPTNFDVDFFHKRYIASCCGKSRQTFYFYNDAHTAKRVEDDVTVTPQSICALVEAMQKSSALFSQTGGVHTASFCSADEVLVSRSDIGRHNALDKVYGYVLQEELDVKSKIISFSGRLSSEVLLKVAKMGVGIVLAKSAPTALALDAADELGITAVGFVRGDTFNIYTHPWRVVAAD